MNGDKFSENIKQFESEWVALRGEEVVAHDKSILEVKKDAEKKGFSEYTLFKVPSFRESFAP